MILVEKYKTSIYEGKCKGEKYFQTYITSLLKCDSCGREWSSSRKEAIKSIAHFCRACKVSMSHEECRILGQKNNYEFIEKKLNDKENIQYYWKCSNGHVVVKDPYLIREGRNCKICRYEKLDKEINEVLKERNFSLIDVITDSKKRILRLQCPLGHIWQTSFSKIRIGRGCHYCNNYYKVTPYKPGYGRRHLQEHKRWKQKVIERDDFTCSKCKTRGGRLIGHHLNSYHANEDERYNIDNGVTMCPKCHTKFHVECGYENNTKEQFLGWIAQ
jgi:hypothetical protein